MKLVFMGTPDFAVPILQALLDAGHEVSAVLTQPDKPQGRRMVLTPPPVKRLAMERNIPVYQPDTLRGGAIAGLLDELRPEAIVVAAYGKLLPEYVLNAPKLGCINVHASLLPKYRGAAPIQRCIIDGETETGVTTMHMAKGLDTGDMILRARVAIPPDMTAGELQEQLSQAGAGLITETLRRIADGTAPCERQDDALSCYASMLKKEDGALDFSQPALSVYNRIRGVTPWPGGFCRLGDKMLKLHAARMAGETDRAPGTLFVMEKRLYAACGDGRALELLELQSEGAKRMTAAAWRAGHAAEIESGRLLMP